MQQLPFSDTPEYLQVVASSVVSLLGKDTEEGKKAIEELKNALGPERVKELQKPGWLAGIVQKLTPGETTAEGPVNDTGPKAGPRR